jgi:hypothetical protein
MTWRFPALAATVLVAAGCDTSGGSPELSPAGDSEAPSETRRPFPDQDFPDTTLELGCPDEQGDFEPVAPMATLPIVHGNQGGIHVEVKLRLAEPLGVVDFRAEVRCATGIDGWEVGWYHVASHPFALEPDGSYVTPTTYLRFDSDDAATYDDLDGRVTCELTLDGETWRSTRAVHLADRRD